MVSVKFSAFLSVASKMTSKSDHSRINIQLKSPVVFSTKRNMKVIYVVVTAATVTFMNSGGLCGQGNVNITFI